MSNDARKRAASAPSDLVGRLVDDLAAVRPVRLARTIALAIALEVVIVGLGAWTLGARVTGVERLADPMPVGPLVALPAGAGARAAALATLSIPGRTVTTGIRAAVVALPLALVVFIVALSPWGGTWKGFSAVFIEGF